MLLILILVSVIGNDQDHEHDHEQEENGRVIAIRRREFALFSFCLLRSIASMFLTHLSCTSCGLRHEWSRLQNLCTTCQKPLFPIYDLAAAGRAFTREALTTREKSLWRYRELLPLPTNTLSR